MRSTQFIGLKQEAIDWLSENAMITRADVCPHCAGVLKTYPEYVSRKESGEYVYGIAEEEIPLYMYELQDGRVAKEIEQHTIESSGPVIFTCLELLRDRLFEWTEEEMEQHTRQN